MIHIDNLELVREDIPMSGAHASPVQYVIMEGVIILLMHALTEGPGWLLRYQGNINIYCHVVIANELRRLGIDPPADLQAQSNQESVNEEEPELGRVSRQSFPTSSLSLLRDPIFSLGEQVQRLMGHMIR